MKLLIRGGTIIPMTQADHTADSLWLHGDLAIDDARIVGIGQIPVGFAPDRTINAEGMIIMPGLVNAHTHLSMGLLRNAADDLDLFTWLNEKIWPAEARLTPEDVYAGSLLGTLELIRSGVTAFADMYFMQEATCLAVQEAGIRARIGLTFFGDQRATDERIPQYEQLHSRWNGAAGGRIHLDTAPHAIYTCTRETLVSALSFSEKTASRIHIHLSETRKENLDSLSTVGLSPASYLLELGLFDRPVYAAHCVHVNADDISLLRRSDVKTVHCPSSNLKLGSGFAPIPAMLEAGIQVALGTDGASSNNNLSMVEEMHIASLLHKGVTGDPTILDAYQTLQAATINGARALGIDSYCGSLEPGKEADIIMFDTRKPHLQPLHNPISAIVYSAQAADVDTVICQGKIVMEKREVHTLDEEHILALARQAAKRLFA